MHKYCATCPTHPLLFKEDEMGLLCGMNGMRSAYRTFVKKHGEIKPFGGHWKR
jgi:hypothetical protein